MITKRSITFSLFALLLGGAFCVPLPSGLPQVTLSRQQSAAKPKTKPSVQNPRFKPLDDVGRFRVMRAFVLTIYHAEHGWSPGDTRNIYLRRFTGVMANSYRKHPDELGAPLPCAMTRIGRLCSAASGAGQYMPDRWDRMKRYCPTVGLFDKRAEEFSPTNQDLVVMCDLIRNGTWSRLKVRASLDAGGLPVVPQQSLNAAIFHAAPVWASFPRSAGDGAGAYGQGSRELQTLQRFYTERLREPLK